jgi:hypothetical protein
VVDRDMRLVAVLVTKPLPGIEQIIDRRVLDREMVQSGLGAELRIIAKLRTAGQ